MKRKANNIDPADWLEGGDTEDDEGVFETNAGIVVNKSRLSTITGLANATLDRAFKDGAPVVGKGTRKQGWRINTAAFFGWYVRKKVGEVEGEGNEEGISFDQAKTRKMVADAERVEAENAKKRGETLTIDEAVQLYREEASIIRAQLLAIPGRLAQALVSETDAAIIESIIADEVNVALQNLTGDNRGAWTGEAEIVNGSDDESDGSADSF